MSLSEINFASQLLAVEDGNTVLVGPFCIFMFRECLMPNISSAWSLATMKCVPTHWPCLAFQADQHWQFMVPVRLFIRLNRKLDRIGISPA